ncbi:MAG: F0F1 ATP synthase subunit B [Candidatus Kerfeldbacteria bacterium]|nr:F0F1 ATP synthase subunit B [Candidatus Kerfeldbacteria bacterium]
MEILEKLGIDWRLIIAQVVNFGILVFVLRRFAYKPLLKTLADRRTKIAKSLADAKELSERVARGEEEHKERLAQAQAEASQIIAAAREQAAGVRQKMLDAAGAEIDALRLEAATDAKRMKEQALSEARLEIAGLVVDATEKILHEKLTSERDKEFVRRTIDGLKE